MPIIYIVIPTTAERRPLLARLYRSILDNTEGKYVICVYENFDGGWVPAVHNALEGLSDDALVVLLGSDVVVEKDWLKNLYAAFDERFPNHDGAAQPYDEINNGSLCQHPLAKAGTIRKYLDREFTHNWSDNLMTDKLKYYDKYLYVPEAKIEHKHWANKKAPMDNTYRVIMESYTRDKEIYDRKKQEFDRYTKSLPKV